MRLLALLALPFTVAAGCGDENPPARYAGLQSIRLVDSVAWSTEDGGGFLRRLELRSGPSIDTVQNLLTREQPAIVGDSLLIGFSYDTVGEVLGIFRFVLRDGSITTKPLPADLNPYVSDAQLSPSAQHIAYVRYDSLGAEGVVREWPLGRIVATTPPMPVPEGDVMRGAATWNGPFEFEILIDPFMDTGGRWVRFRGRVGVTGLSVDTISVPAG